MSNKKILVLPGDGIGVEVMQEVINIMNWMVKNKSISFDVTECLVGGSAYDQEGDSISDSTMDEALKADAILFGAVGGSKFDCPIGVSLIGHDRVLGRIRFFRFV